MLLIMEVEPIYNTEHGWYEYTFSESIELYVTKIKIEFPAEITEDTIMSLLNYNICHGRIDARASNDIYYMYIDYSLLESIFNKKVSYDGNIIKFNIYIETPITSNIDKLFVILPCDWKIVLTLSSTQKIHRYTVRIIESHLGNSMTFRQDYFAIIVQKSHNLQSIDFEMDNIKYHIDSELMNKVETDYINIYLCHMKHCTNISLKEMYKHPKHKRNRTTVIKNTCFQNTSEIYSLLIAQSWHKK